MSRKEPLLEDIAPEYSDMDDVTAASLAKHYAAEALVDHHTRILIDPLANPALSDDWKRALRQERQGYAYSLMLRNASAFAGDHFADRLAKMLWSVKNEMSDYAEDLVIWLEDDGVDVGTLAAMGRLSRERLDVLHGKRGES